MDIQEIEDNFSWLLKLSKDDLIRIIARLICDSEESTYSLLYDLEAIWRKSDE